jgi:hypothetical protein
MLKMEKVELVDRISLGQCIAENPGCIIGAFRCKSCTDRDVKGGWYGGFRIVRKRPIFRGVH